MLIYDWLKKESEDNASKPLIKFESTVQINLKKHKQF